MEGKGHLKGVVPFGSKGPVVIGFLPDAHFHLGFVADKAAFVAETTRAESFVFAASVTPAEYRETRSDLACCVGSAHADRVGSFGPVRLGVGLHPWWVPADKGKLRSLLAAFDAALPETNFVGEVGLDFSKRRTGTHDAQLTAFRHIAKQCADAGDKVLSLHCVKAYDDMLRILEETDCLHVHIPLVQRLVATAAVDNQGGLFLFGGAAYVGYEEGTRVRESHFPEQVALGNRCAGSKQPRSGASLPPVYI